MIKALLKKQAGELLSFITGSGKTGKSKNKKIGILYIIVFSYVFIAGGYMMYSIADYLCAPLSAAGMDWLFFALVGLFAIGLSIIFGIFTSQPMLYDAKDNDFLLSLPIPASKILFSRMFMLYAQNLLCTLLIFVPALVVYNRTVVVKALAVTFQVLILLILPLFSLIVECIVGWIVALISSKMRNKNVITLVLSVALLAGYFYLTTKMTGYMEYIIANSKQFGASLINAFYPFYQMGLGASGEVRGFLIFTGISVVLFAIVYLVLSVSFIKIITTKKGAKKVKYTGQALKTRSCSSALFRKELTRFFTTPMYMLNCGLGVIFHIAIAVIVIVKKDMLSELFAVMPVFSNHMLPMIVALVSLIAGMDLITAPAVSLEGKNIWILQTMPLDGWQILKAKLKLHLVINLPSSILCIVVLCITMGIGISGIIIAEVLTIIFVFFCAVIGLVINIKMPNFNWTSEVVVIKQSSSVLVSMLINIGTVFAFGGLYYLMQYAMSTEAILSIFIIFLLAVTSAFTFSLKNNGSEKLMYL